MLNALLLTLACGSSPEADVASSSPSKAPAAAPAAAPFDHKGQLTAYKGRFAPDPKLSPEDVALMDPEELVLTRNEIYARYGRAFKTDEIRQHFEAQSWYQVDPDYSDARLTENDKANAALIKSFEGKGADPLKRGEYDGNPPLMFVDSDTVTLNWGYGMYEHLNVTHKWESRGEYVITWMGTDRFDPASKECQEAYLWKLDEEHGMAHKVAELKAG